MVNELKKVKHEYQPMLSLDKTKSVDDLKENLWFELKTTDLNGAENVYQI